MKKILLVLLIAAGVCVIAGAGYKFGRYLHQKSEVHSAVGAA